MDDLEKQNRQRQLQAIRTGRTLQVRNRLLSAYQDIMRMGV